MRHIIREILGFTLYLFAVFFKRKPLILSLYFHNPSSRVFEDIIKWCLSNKYTFVDINDVYKIIINKKQPDERIAFISFDDGWRSNLNLLPIIEEYNIPITIFVTTKPVISGNYWWEYVQKIYGYKKIEELKKSPYNVFKDNISSLESSQLLQRSSINETELTRLIQHPLVNIQSHTVTHPILTNCDDDVLKYELTESKKYLEEISHNSIYALSYPNGNVGEREVLAVKQAGYKLAFTTRAETIDVAHTNIFLIPRMAMNTFGGKYENISKILGLWQKFVK